MDARWAQRRSLWAAIVLSSLTVAWWWFSESRGHGDLRAYLWVQFLPMLLIPCALLLQMKPLAPQALPGSVWYGALALYAAAKVMELADRRVLDALGILSGHTLKHLLAATAAAWLLRAAVFNSDSRR